MRTETIFLGFFLAFCAHPSLANEGSITAVSVAKAFARSVLSGSETSFPRAEGELTDHLCNEGSEALTTKNWLLVKCVSIAPWSCQSWLLDKLVAPGYDKLVTLRKKMIRTKVIDAIEKRGVKQVVFLGGGYDIRPVVTARQYPFVKVYEIDRGTTRERKLAGLRNFRGTIGMPPFFLEPMSDDLVKVGANMHFIDCDLSQRTLHDALITNGFVENEDSLIVAEGVAMYLNEAANQRLLKTVGEFISPNSEMLISYSPNIVYTSVQRSAQEASKELLQFFLPVDQVASFVATAGFEVVSSYSAWAQLRDIGDSNSAYWDEHPERIMEIYYTLRPRVMDRF